MEFLCLFLRHHWVGKPVVAPANVNCFLRLTQILHATDYLLIIYKLSGPLLAIRPPVFNSCEQSPPGSDQ